MVDCHALYGGARLWRPAAAPITALIGLAIALFGLTMETLADIQLTKFRATANRATF